MNHSPSDSIAAWLKLMSHPLRLRLLVSLLRQPGQAARSLEVELAIKASTLAEQLVILKRGQLIYGKRQGQLIHYWLSDAELMSQILLQLGIKP